MKKKFLTLATLFVMTLGTGVLAEGADLPKYESFSREMYNNCIIVYPKNDRGGYIVAKGIASEALKNDRIKMEVLNTEEVKEETIASKNVIMIGNSENNSFILNIVALCGIFMTYDAQVIK